MVTTTIAISVAVQTALLFRAADRQLSGCLSWRIDLGQKILVAIAVEHQLSGGILLCIRDRRNVRAFSGRPVLYKGHARVCIPADLIIARSHLVTV